MEKINDFGMKDCLGCPELGWKYSNSLTNEEDEPIYTYSDNYMYAKVLKVDESVLLTNTKIQKIVMIF